MKTETHIEWTGDNLKEVIEFIGLHPSAAHWTWEEYEQVVASEGLKIFNSDGSSYMAQVGTLIAIPF